MADLDSTNVLRKTESGVNAIKLRDRALTQKLRMLLILVDGTRTVAELSKSLPNPDEARLLLDELLAGGHVCVLDLPKTVSKPVPAVAKAASDAPDASNTSLKAAIRRAARLLEDTLGPTCEPLCLQLEKCNSIDQFTAKVHEFRRIVAAMRSEKKADEFVTAALSP